MSLPKRANVQVPYFSQLDNRLEPYGTCNVTCVAMVMASKGIVGDGSMPQLEDQLTAKCYKEGWDRHSPADLQKLFAWKKVLSKFSYTATQAELKACLASGRPAILHGYFTRSGHIIVAKGYDDTAYNGTGAFICHDPNGEWNRTGYTHQAGAGKDVLYSYAMIRETCQTDGQFWVHFC